MNDQLDSIAGCRSEIHGDAPTVEGFGTRDIEFASITEKVQEWIDNGIEPSEIGIAVRSRTIGETVAKTLANSRIPAKNLADKRGGSDGVAIGTMHRMKGLEFRCLAIAAVSSKQ